MSGNTKKATWVREAVAITDAVTQNGEGRYLCPLCLEWFDDLQDLSLEHAPPSSVGGSHIAVTCRACNSTAGSSVDTALHWTETVRQFGSQAMTKPMSATFSFAGIEQRVAAQSGPDGLSIMGIGKQNHSEVAPAMITAFDEMVARGSAEGTMTLSLRSPDFRAASIGWLRAAYLATFAMLGYLYVLRKELDDVRLQIRDPTARILERYCVMTRGGPSDRRIAIVREPAELASVTVFSNDCAVFLPSPETPGTSWRALSDGVRNARIA